MQERIDHNGAIGAWATLASVGEKVPLGDFMPKWNDAPADTERPAQTPEQMMATLRTLQKRAKRKRKQEKERREHQR